MPTFFEFIFTLLRSRVVIKNHWKIKILLLLLVAVNLACGLPSLGGSSEPTPTAEIEAATIEPTEAVVEESEPVEEADAAAVEEPTPEEEAKVVPAPPTSSLRDTMQMVKSATIQIETDASLTDIDGAVYAQSGTGSGFIIDESGIAVTNNHVVTGGRSWKVYVGGSTKALNAKVLGVSECSDLAVIDIEGDGYPTLEWYDGEIFTGLPVYAAGFPLGDPEFTLTRGIVAKEEANGQTSWASVEGVIEHDAVINPGNSGGPLVTEDGQVVAVNYANLDSQQQGYSILYFAIARDEARDIIDRLREGEDFLAIGVNGQALLSDDGEFSGIWVQSVQSGSVADKARIEGGDIITSLEERELATEGTMREYCDTLRSHDPEDTLNLEILRIAAGQVLEGQINGRELEVTEEFDNSEFLNDSSSDNILGPGSDSGYVIVTDNSGAFEMEIPAGWTDIDGSPWLDDDGTQVAAAIDAANDLSIFRSLTTDSGIQFVVFNTVPDFSPAAFLDGFDHADLTGDCGPAQRFDYNEHPGYTGVMDFYENCGAENNRLVFLSIKPTDASEFAIYLTGLNLSRKDMQHLFDTFDLVGALP